MTDVKHGFVKFFDSREGKHFGFICGADGDEYFFHADDCRPIKSGAFAPSFDRDARHLMPRPDRGERVVFQPAENRRGLKAAPWCYESDYLKAKEQCCPVQKEQAFVLEMFPFLLQILEKNIGYHANVEPFRVGTDRIRPELWESKGMNWFRAGRDEKYYLVSQSGSELAIHELRSESWWGDGADEGFTDAPTLNVQRMMLNILPDQVRAIVFVDRSDYNAASFGWVGRQPGPKKSEAIVYLP